MAEVIPCLTPAERKAALPRALEALEAGRVVVLPTETVYGLCARLNAKDARERIYELKGRPSEKDLPCFVSGSGDAWTFCNELPRRARVLMDTFWPGPLTIVVGPGAGTALRCPDHPFTTTLLAEVSGPVVATSANRSGDPPATRAEDAARIFEAEADLLIFDGGPAREGVASTVLRVEDDGALRVFREGALKRAALEAAVPFTVAVVCTGNTCRSPMAEAVLRHELGRALGVKEAALADEGFRVFSAGTEAFSGDPMASDARAALSAAGIPVPEHRAQRFDAALAAECDLVLTMTHHHDLAVQAISSVPRRPFDPDGDVADPYGRGPAVYAMTLERLRRVAATLAERWISQARGRG